jgi:hypothetical protein
MDLRGSAATPRCTERHAGGGIAARGTAPDRAPRGGGVSPWRRRSRPASFRRTASPAPSVDCRPSRGTFGRPPLARQPVPPSPGPCCFGRRPSRHAVVAPSPAAAVFVSRFPPAAVFVSLCLRRSSCRCACGGLRVAVPAQSGLRVAVPAAVFVSWCRPRRSSCRGAARGGHSVAVLAAVSQVRVILATRGGCYRGRR